MVLLAALPLVGLLIVWWYRGLIKFNSEGSMTLAIFGSSGVLAYCMISYQLVEYTTILLEIIVPSLVIGGLSILASKEFNLSKTWRILVLLCMGAYAYSYGAVVLINCAFDRSAPVLHSAKVTYKQLSTRGNDKYYLHVDLLHPLGKVNVVSGDVTAFEQVEDGDTITVKFHEGRLHKTWIEAEPR
jgi:hypothetical protein